MSGAPDAMLARRDWGEIADDLALLGLLHGQELTAETLAQLRSADPADWFAMAPDGEDFRQGVALLRQGLASVAELPDRAALEDLAAEYAAIYLTFAYHAAPTESVWRDPDGLERQGPMFAVRQRFARHGLEVADWRRRSDDHLVHELAYLAALLREGTADALAEAATFLRDHLLVWVPAFAGRVARRCHHPLYAGLQLAMVGFLQGLAALLGDATQIDMTPPEDEVVAAAMATASRGRPAGAAARGR